MDMAILRSVLINIIFTNKHAAKVIIQYRAFSYTGNIVQYFSDNLVGDVEYSTTINEIESPYKMESPMSLLH